MRLTHVWTVLALAVLLNGCTVRSLNPLYTEKDVAFEPGLLGTWEQDTNEMFAMKWICQKAGENAYRIVWRRVDEEPKNAEAEYTLEGHLVKLSGHVFLDLEPACDDPFAVPAHVFVKIQLSGDTLRTAILDPLWVNKAADRMTLGLGHLRIGGNVVLTAPTNELQDFFAQNAGDESVFDSGGGEYRRTASDKGK
jgi:hypothetical protein